MSNLIQFIVQNQTVTAAVVSAFVSALVATLTLLVNPFSQRFVETAKVELQKDLEDHKKQITRELSESNARLSYEFEARKRLYGQVEPILFELFEASEQCYYRVASLVRTFRSGHLREKAGWLSQQDYYMYSSIYWLFLPLAIFRNLQRTATFFDLRLDENIRLRYFLLKRSYLIFTDDFVFARQEPELSYEPNQENWRELRVQNPASFWRQGLVLGRLDRLIEAMVLIEGNSRRVITFGEFERYIRNDKDVMANFEPALDVFMDFNFEERPILARMLLAQAIIHRLILYTYTCETDINGLYSALDRFVDSDEFRQDLAWWSNDASAPRAVVSYLKERLGWISPEHYAILNS